MRFPLVVPVRILFAVELARRRERLLLGRPFKSWSAEITETSEIIPVEAVDASVP